MLKERIQRLSQEDIGGTTVRSRTISGYCMMSKLGTKQNESFFRFLNEFIEKIKGVNIRNAYFILDNVRFVKVTAIQEQIIEAGHVFNIRSFVIQLKCFSSDNNPCK